MVESIESNRGISLSVTAMVLKACPLRTNSHVMAIFRCPTCTMPLTTCDHSALNDLRKGSAVTPRGSVMSPAVT